MKKLGPFQTSNFTSARASAITPILTWLAHTTQVLWVLKSLGIYSDYGKKHWTIQRYTSHFLRFSNSHRTVLRVVKNLKMATHSLFHALSISGVFRVVSRNLGKRLVT